MQTTRKTTLFFWLTPLVGTLIGLLYLIGFWIGGRPTDGVIGLAIMIAFTVGLILLGKRSETVQGLLDHRDERISGIDLRATAATAIAMIVTVLIGFVVEIAHHRSGLTFALVGAVGGVSYVAAVGYLRLRR